MYAVALGNRFDGCAIDSIDLHGPFDTSEAAAEYAYATGSGSNYYVLDLQAPTAEANWLSFDCPGCVAPAGSKCRNRYDGTVLDGPHPSRAALTACYEPGPDLAVKKPITTKTLNPLDSPSPHTP